MSNTKSHTRGQSVLGNPKDRILTQPGERNFPSRRRRLKKIERMIRESKRRMGGDYKTYETYETII